MTLPETPARHRELAPRWTAVPLAAAAALLVVAACIDEDSRCGDDMTYQDGVCVKKTDAATDTGGSDLQPAADGGTGAETGAPPGMGTPCTTASQCTAPASYCTWNPASNAGICTLRDCTLSPDDCPAGYHCWDGATVMKGLPTMCLAD